MALNAVRKDNNIESHLQENARKQKSYLEILGDTVLPFQLIVTVILNIVFALGGYLLGQKIFPAIAQEKMVNSYSLLLGIGGSVICLILCATLFKPNRILTEEEASEEDMKEIFRDLQIDPREEYELIMNDPVTKQEMEELGILGKFKKAAEGTDK